METKSPLPHSQTTNIPYSETQRCSSHFHNIIYIFHFNIILQTVPSFSQAISHLS